LENERVGDRAVLPCNPPKAGGDRDQNLGYGRRVHRELGACQQRVELVGADGDRYQRVSTGVVMIEASREPLACVDGQLELELVAAAPGRIGPHRVRDLRAAIAEVDPAAESRLDARGAVEKARKLGERDRSLVIEGARRMTCTQELRSWRDGLL